MLLTGSNSMKTTATVGNALHRILKENIQVTYLQLRCSILKNSKNYVLSPEVSQSSNIKATCIISQISMAGVHSVAVP
jgi:hypothetical protein